MCFPLKDIFTLPSRTGISISNVAMMKRWESSRSGEVTLNATRVNKKLKPQMILPSAAQMTARVDCFFILFASFQAPILLNKSPVVKSNFRKLGTESAFC